MTFGYDNADRLTSVTDWNSNAVANGYDSEGAPERDRDREQLHMTPQID